MSWNWMHDGYTLVRASDLNRDGMTLELYDRAQGRLLVLEAFYSDVDGSMLFEKFAEVPPEIEADFKAKAYELLPPVRI